MSDKMIEIKGRQISEDTVVEALKKHCGFEETKFEFNVDKYIYVGHRFEKTASYSYPYYIAIAKVWGCKPTTKEINADGRFFFSKHSIEELITGLQKMIRE